jgi:predicted nucleic acid-binding protein
VSSALLVLDASAIINVLGCGSPERILGPFGRNCVVEEGTLKEVIRNPFDGQPAAVYTSKLISAGHLTVVRMNDASYAHYIQLVGGNPEEALGHGESAALAYAQEAVATVVLDDRKARRIGRTVFPNCPQSTSVALFRKAAELAGMTKEEIGVLVKLACDKARMHILVEDREWIRDLE